MYKVLNIFFFLLILIFFWYVYIYYFSKINIHIKETNRTNIDLIIKDKISNIPILKNDTNNVIEFNNSILNKKNIDKSRSFWKLLN
ncbi:hypothetical protein OAS59_01600 [Pelagibacteraceae bacterium]|nr:hypothetical protein [Pelagibacteraceae bacterium]